MKKLALITVVALIVSFTASAQKISFDVVKSELIWTGKKVVGEHYGKVTLKEGNIELKGNEIRGGKFVIDLNSITSEDLTDPGYNAKLIGHLKSDDFFGTEKYPEAVLDIVGSNAFKNGKATVSGRLTIKGITNPISFEATQNGNNFNAVISVDRTLYGLKYGSGKFVSGLGDNMIKDEFTIAVKLVSK